MATNIVHDPGDVLNVVVTNPTTPSSGDPVRFGDNTGIALTDEGSGGNTATTTSVKFGSFVATFNVHAGNDGAGGAGAVNVGDPVYYDDTQSGSPLTNLNRDSANGYFFGYALQSVTSTQTTSIEVLHYPAPVVSAQQLGTATITATQLADDAVTTAKILNDNVTAAKLANTLATGTLQLPLVAWREIASDDIQNLAAHGGILAKDSTPILEYVNGDTDSALRLNWASSNNNEVAINVILPQDLDATQDMTLHVYAAMAGATDTPVLDLDLFFGVGDTKVSDATGAITGTGAAEYTATIAAADIPSNSIPLSIEITPGAHTTDALYVYGIWIEYARV